MLLRRRAPFAVAALAVAVAVAGCGSTAKDQVKKEVNLYLTATKTHDVKTLCNDVLAETLLAHLRDVNYPCEQAMKLALQGVDDPQLAIGRIIVNGNKASVIAITTATHQGASLDAIELVKQSDGWRVSSLGTPDLGSGTSTSSTSGGATAPSPTTSTTPSAPGTPSGTTTTGSAPSAG